MDESSLNDTDVVGLVVSAGGIEPGGMHTLMQARPRAVKIKSLGSAGSSYRSRWWAVLLGWSAALVGTAFLGLLCALGGMGLLVTLFFIGLVWGVYYVGDLLMSSVVRHVCPWCSKFLPSTQAWKCPSCNAGHSPPESPSMFSGCPTCRNRPALYQCPHCANVVQIDDEQPVTGMEQCAVALGQQLMSPKESIIKEMQLESRMQQTMIQLMDNQLVAADKTVKLKKARVRVEQGARAAGYAEQTEVLEELEGRRRSIREHFAGLRMEAMEKEKLRDEALQLRLAELDAQEREAMARASA